MRALLLIPLLSLVLPQGPRELWREGERARAIQALNAKLAEDERPELRRRLIDWCFTVHKYSAALEAAEGLGDEGDPHRGRALYFLGRYEEALALLDEGDGEAVLMRVEALRALGRDWGEWIEPAAELLGEGDRRVALLRARALLEGGDHAAAVEAFEGALKRAPLEAEALFGLGRALVLSGERTRGLEVLERHRALTPLLDALDFAERGLDLAPLHGPNHAALGDAWRELVPFDGGSYARAEAAYQAALSRMKGKARVPVHLRRARLIADHGDGLMAAAFSLDAALKEGEDPQLLVRAADYFSEAGDAGLALLRLERALALRPGDRAIRERIERVRRGR
ncbi:MAG: tetratricopeptide repeat protein [Planctomycetes bacterium]|nr:tetratricopeptide repeat protein [Planctomycetota bacterium]